MGTSGSSKDGAFTDFLAKSPSYARPPTAALRIRIEMIVGGGSERD